MQVKFWGTRGSLPTPMSAGEVKHKFRRVLEGAAGLNLTNPTVVNQYLERLPVDLKQNVGGNTTCLEIRSGKQRLILDAGSGLRLLGLELMKEGFAQGHQQADVLISHTHWDHIIGFPFFQPAFIPNNTITFHSPFPDLADRLEQQQHPLFFPVDLDYMSASLEFKSIKPNEWNTLGKLKIYPMRLSHPGVTYGYRIEDENSCLVMASDSEYQKVKPEDTEHFIKFFTEADLLIFDAQYSLSEAFDRPDWGHSTAIVGAEFAHRANVKRLALFHHDPTSTDEQIWSTKEQTDAYLMHRREKQPQCEVLVAYDGLEVEF